MRVHTSEGINTLHRLLESPVYVLGFDVSLIDYIDTKPYLVDGRMFENAEECIISKNNSYAEDNWNELKPGDKIVFNDANGVYKEFDIVGIVDEDVVKDSHEIEQGAIYTTTEGAEHFDPLVKPCIIERQTGYFMQGYDAVIFLESYEYYESFQDKIISESKPFNPSGRYSETYDGIYRDYIYPATDNLRTTMWFSTSVAGNTVALIFFIRLIVILVTIISTISLLTNRKYEIAVLRSVGMKKSRLIMSFLIESLVFIWAVTFVSFMTAQIITLVSSDSLLQMQGVFSADRFASAFDGMKFLISQNIVGVFGNASAVAAISVILACINIIRFEPLKIFSKQY